MTQLTPGNRLRAAQRQGFLQIPGAFNALAARMIQQCGFPAMYLSGAAFSAGALALPDIGLFTLTELAAETTRLTRAVDVPLVVDADTGFGAAINVERTVIELEAAGAAAIQLEDQQLPKRCGHLSGKALVSCEEMCAKIRAAASARVDSSLVILARTDARGVTSLDDAITRARAYAAAGADWIFPEALASEAEFATVAQALDVPLVANMTEFGKSPLLKAAQLQQLGYAGALYPVSLLRTAMGAVQQLLDELRDTGTQAGQQDGMQTRAELYELLKYDGYEQRDRAYFGGGETGGD